MSDELADKEYWQSSWKKSSKLDVAYVANPFKKQFNKHIPHVHQDKLALEIGCVPGVYLGHLGRDFGYIVEGIDYVTGAKETTLNTLRKFGIENAKIYESDFLSWVPDKLYNLICSFGFIEHFVDVESMVNKHLDLLESGGTLILEVPNFSSLQYMLHKYLDRVNLERHNTEIMNLDFFKKIAQKHDLCVQCIEYTGGAFDFWWENETPTKIQKLAYNLLRPLAYIGRKIPINNRFASPFIILIATKRTTSIS